MQSVELVIVLWFRLQWRSTPLKNFEGMEHYDWLQNGCFIGQGLHCGQDYSSGEPQAWMKKWYKCQHGNTFCQGIFFGGQVSWATSNPQTSFLGNLKPSDKKLDLRRTPTWGNFKIISPSCPPNLNSLYTLTSVMSPSIMSLPLL